MGLFEQSAGDGAGGREVRRNRGACVIPGVTPPQREVQGAKLRPTTLAGSDSNTATSPSVASMRKRCCGAAGALAASGVIGTHRRAMRLVFALAARAVSAVASSVPLNGAASRQRVPGGAAGGVSAGAVTSAALATEADEAAEAAGAVDAADPMTAADALASAGTGDEAASEAGASGTLAASVALAGFAAALAAEAGGAAADATDGVSSCTASARTCRASRSGSCSPPAAAPLLPTPPCDQTKKARFASSTTSSKPRNMVSTNARGRLQANTDLAGHDLPQPVVSAAHTQCAVARHAFGHAVDAAGSTQQSL